VLVELDSQVLLEVDKGQLDQILYSVQLHPLAVVLAAVMAVQALVRQHLNLVLLEVQVAAAQEMLQDIQLQVVVEILHLSHLHKEILVVLVQ
jgi:hypothetical protein